MKPYLLFLSLLISCSCKTPVGLDIKETKLLFSQLYIFKKASLQSEAPLVIDSVFYDDAVVLEYYKESPMAGDMNYIKRQLASRRSVKWDKSIFNSLKIISDRQLDSLSKPDPFINTPTHVKVSKAYFSKNKQYCLLFYSYYCGNLCAENAVNVYKKVNGKWQFFKSLMSVVS